MADKLSADLIYVSPQRKRERERELGRNPRKKGGRERKEGGKASKVRARARSHKPQRRRRRRPFSKAGPKAFTMARTPPSSPLYRPGLSHSLCPLLVSPPPLGKKMNSSGRRRLGCVGARGLSAPCWKLYCSYDQLRMKRAHFLKFCPVKPSY